MSIDWISVDVDLSDKPEVRRIARTLGIDRDSVAGKLVRVWGWFDRGSVDGVVDGAVDADVDDLARHNGFAQAMACVGWLVIDANKPCISIPKFDRHHGNSAKKRLLKSSRQARWRERKADASVDADVEQVPSTFVDACVDVDASTTEQNRTVEERASNLPNGKLLVAASGNLPAETGQNGNNEKAVRSRCPTAEIVELYHAELPELPRVEKVTKAREGYIRQRWTQDLKTLEEWRNYFAFVRKSKFLMGLSQAVNGRPPFRADLEWITRPGNFAKIAEEKYHHA